jgi:hypothetical protein
MAEMKSEIEVTLVELAIHAVAKPQADSRHLLGAALLWPRVGTARKEYPAALKLARGRWEPKGRPWTQRVLFKEAVQGRFGFEVTLTEALSDEAAAEFLRSVASQFVKLSSDAAGDFLAPPYLGALAEIPLNYLVKALLKEKAPGTLAAGALDLDIDQLPAAGESVRWEVPLLTPGGIRITTRRRTGKTTQRRQEVVLPAGEEAGRCVVDVRVL